MVQDDASLRSNTSSKDINPYLFFALLGCLLFATTLALLYVLSDLPLLTSLFFSINSSALILLGLDKSLAHSNSTRLPEAFIFVVALCGGSPGTLLGIHVFKHKTRKAAFHFVLLLIFAAQLYAMRLLGISLSVSMFGSFDL